MAEEIVLKTAKTKENPVSLKEYTLDVNTYGTPLDYKNFNALGTLIMRLILLEPGTITHSPKMGVGLISKYRYMQSDKLDAFVNEVKNQIKDYIDPTAVVDMDVNITDQNVMVMDLKINSAQFRYYFDRDKVTLKMIALDQEQ